MSNTKINKVLPRPAGYTMDLLVYYSGRSKPIARIHMENVNSSLILALWRQNIRTEWDKIRQRKKPERITNTK